MRPGSEKAVQNRLLLFLFLLISGSAAAQTASKDLKDVYLEWKHDTLQKPEARLAVGKSYISVLPFIGYAPANGFVAGGALSYSRLLGHPPTNLSTLMMNFQVTSKKQLIINARSKVFFDHNKWFLQGDWRLLFFTQPTYGLGIDNSEENRTPFHINTLVEETNPAGEDMNYNQLRFYEEAGVKLGESDFFASFGIAIDQHFKIVDKRLNTDPQSPDFYITNHYKYSVANNFNPEKYGTQGLRFTLLTDTRDNEANCFKGYFASVSVLQNVKIGENSQKSTQLFYDARYYWAFLPRNPAHVLAYWGWGTFLMAGSMPYLALPSIGWDTYNRSGRGFIQGRYRGLSMVYNEAEYRFPITRNRLFGGVLFTNVTTASSDSQQLFDAVGIGYGAGLRLQIDKLARTNFGVDFGIGSDGSTGIYFNLQETF